MLALASSASAGTEPQPGQTELKRLSIEELMNLDVTLAARRPEPLAATPAAISVVTGEDIRRSGVTTIADAIALADAPTSRGSTAARGRFPRAGSTR